MGRRREESFQSIRRFRWPKGAREQASCVPRASDGGCTVSSPSSSPASAWGGEKGVREGELSGRAVRPCSRVSAITKFCLSLCALQSPPPVHAARGRTPSSHRSRADGSAGWAIHAGGPRGMQTADGVGGGRGASRTLTWALRAGGPASWVRSGGRAIRPNHPDGPWQVEP